MKNYELKCLEGIHPRILATDEFMVKNRLRFVWTPEAIVNKIKTNSDMFGFTAEVLVDYLPWEHRKQFFKNEYLEEVNSGKETPKPAITDPREAVQDMLDYMVFAWMKAMDQRGISASRSIHKIGAWLWLLGREDLEGAIHEDRRYNPYGMPALIYVCDKLGIDVPGDCTEFAEKPV